MLFHVLFLVSKRQTLCFDSISYPIKCFLCKANLIFLLYQNTKSISLAEFHASICDSEG